MGFPSAPDFTARVPIQFISDDKPSLSVTGANVLINNPISMKVISGTQMKTEQDINLINHLRGDAEYAPTIQIEWKVLGYDDYKSLAALQPYYLTFITFRNIGYYGRLVMAGPESVPGRADAVHAIGTFYALSPSDDGGAVSVERVSDPTTFAKSDRGVNTGYIPTSPTQYYFLTFSTRYGETNYQSLSWTPSAANDSLSLTWTWPTGTNYVEYATIYSALNSSGNSARIMAQVPNGLTARWIDYVGYSGCSVTGVLPSKSTAYRGRWQHGIWYNE